MFSNETDKFLVSLVTACHDHNRKNKHTKLAQYNYTFFTIVYYGYQHNLTPRYHRNKLLHNDNFQLEPKYKHSVSQLAFFR